MTARPDHALQWLSALAARHGFAAQWSFIDRCGACHGAGWPVLDEALDGADFVLTVADPPWFEELGRCGRRLFVDGDPMFTQVALATGKGSRADAPRHYDTLFTYAARIGRDDCLVPSAGRAGLPTRPVVATAGWDTTGASWPGPGPTSGSPSTRTSRHAPAGSATGARAFSLRTVADRHDVGQDCTTWTVAVSEELPLAPPPK